MQLSVEVFKSLEIPNTLRWNNRRFWGEVLESIGVPSAEFLSVMLTLDKIEKIGNDGVIKELVTKGLDSKVTNAITDLIYLVNPTFENAAIFNPRKPRCARSSVPSKYHSEIRIGAGMQV